MHIKILCRDRGQKQNVTAGGRIRKCHRNFPLPTILPVKFEPTSTLLFLDGYKYCALAISNCGVYSPSSAISSEIGISCPCSLRHEIQVCSRFFYSDETHKCLALRLNLTLYPNGGVNTSRERHFHLNETKTDLGRRYDALKKHIYQLEKQQQHHHFVGLESTERSTLLGEHDAIGTDAIFIPLLDKEIQKIVAFYEDKEKELLEDLEELEKDVLKMDDIGLGGGYHYEDYADDDDDEDDDSIASPRSPDGARRSLSRHRKSSSAGRVRRNTRSSQS